MTSIEAEATEAAGKPEMTWRQDEDQLRRLFETRRARLVVLGLGHVGLAAAVAFAEVGFTVIGVDRNAERAAAVDAGRSPVVGVAAEALCDLRRRGRLRATTDERVLARADVVLVCVPTPLLPDRKPDLGPLKEAFAAIARGFAHAEARGVGCRLVVVESTTYPGATREHLVPALRCANTTPGHDVFVAFSPERIDPGNEQYPLQRIPKVVGGLTSRCRAMASLLYEQVVAQVVPVSSLEAAEMTKLLENTFRSVNIALVNEIAVGCRSLGLDPWEVIDAAATKPYGFLPFFPGPGVGGHCVPIDPLWLAETLKHRGAPTRFIELADAVHADTTELVVRRTCEVLGAGGGQLPLSGRAILLSGVAYKRDIDDVRESPALTVRARLSTLGARVDYHDPWVPEIAELGIRSVPEPVVYGSYDVVVVLTDHTNIDYGQMLVDSKLIVDTRNALGRVGRRILGGAHVVPL